MRGTRHCGSLRLSLGHLQGIGILKSSYARILDMLQQSQPQTSQRMGRMCRKQLT
jgi:hypothetical protein